MKATRIEDYGRSELLDILAVHDPDYAKKGPGKPDIVTRLHELGIRVASLQGGSENG